MEILLWLVVLLPFAGALTLMLFGASMPKKAAGAIGCTSIGLSWIAAMVIVANFLSAGRAFDTTLYPWIKVDGFQVGMGLRLDALSLVMMSIVTFVGFLIHLYSAQSMYEEDSPPRSVGGYHRFFAYMNLFVGSMLVLVLANNLLPLYLGWEGVGLCSYLLIGFWYKDRANGYAAQKAFIVTRIGDTAMAVGLFLIFYQLGTLNIQRVLTLAPRTWTPGDTIVTAIALLLLGGAIGKSAQLPLQTWLPDAMAGPTPVSALIHAATMVTAGVYLIARTHVIFALAPQAQLIVAIIGAATLVYAGFSALVQSDIKRVLAYSTISQIGYMFLALGVGAWTAAMFHFVTHAFFKALLFLSAGIVGDALHHERDLFKMGGLKNRLPVAYWTFLIGAASLSALPLVTAGFYSKDAILFAAYSSSRILWAAGMLGALITSAYSFRAFFLAFYGDTKTEVSKLPGALMKFAVVVLAFLSITAGFAKNIFEGLLSGIFPEMHLGAHSIEITLAVISSLWALFGVYLAWVYFTRPQLSRAFGESPVGRRIHHFLYTGWGFDWLYDRLFVRPFKAIAFGNASDFVDKFFVGLAGLARYGNLALSATQTGRLRNYVTGMLIGAILIAAIVLLK